LKNTEHDYGYPDFVSPTVKKKKEASIETINITMEKEIKEQD